MTESKGLRQEILCINVTILGNKIGGSINLRYKVQIEKGLGYGGMWMMMISVSEHVSLRCICHIQAKKANKWLDIWT